MPTRPDIVFLGINFPPEPTGIAPYIGSLAIGLSRDGAQIVAHTAHPHYPGWEIVEGYGQWKYVERLEGIQVQRRLHYVPRSPRGVRRFISEMSFGVRLVCARWRRPRVVVAVSPSLFSTALAVLRLRLTPGRPRLIIWVQDLYTLGLQETGEGRGVVRWLTEWVESHTLRAADRVVVIHKRFEEFVTSELGVAHSRVVVVRNWTHLTKAAPVNSAAARAELDWPRDVTLAVHTGNMGTKQGLENIIDAARMADERNAAVHFVLVGDGGERANLQARAIGIDRITFVGPLKDAEYRLALGAADVLLVNEKPGVSTMAVPSKLTSYFDAGRPIVAATDLGGITASELAAAEAGVVVRAGDPGALLDAVLAMNADKGSAAAYGANGRRYREAALDQDVAIHKWAAIIKSIAYKP